MTRRILLGATALILALPLRAVAQAGATDLRSQITKLDQAWQTAYNAGDAAALAALYTPDAKVMAPGHAAASGQAAIQAFFVDDLKQHSKNTLTTGEVLDGGSFAIAIGGFVATGPDGKHLDHGTYTTIYKKVDGGWKIFRDTWNSSMAH
jgi:uncharacterized protein (TIGR02246 family)